MVLHAFTEVAEALRPAGKWIPAVISSWLESLRLKFSLGGWHEKEAFMMPLRSVWWLRHLLDALRDRDLSIRIAWLQSRTRMPVFNVPNHFKNTQVF